MSISVTGSPRFAIATAIALYTEFGYLESQKLLFTDRYVHRIG